MSEWSNVNLASLLSFGNGKSRPLDSGNIPVYGGNGIMSYVSHFNYDHETIIIGRVGAYCGATYYENKPIWISDNALSAKAVGVHNTKYLYYLLKNLDLNQFAEGSSHPLLTQKLLNSIETKTALNPNEQKSIASVLSSLDDKIDLLHCQNKTLESMAETLFRQWFIEESQDEWPEATLNQYVELNKSSIDKKYNIKEIQYLDTGSLTKGKISELQKILLSDAPSRAKRLVNNFDIIISTVRPDQCHYGICIDPPSNLVVSTGFCVITSKSLSPFFIYYLITSEDMTEYLHSIAEGSTSTYPSLKPEDIGNIPFLYPSEEKLKNFHDLVGSYWNKIHNNHKKIQTLETLRDTLLPKLMSGEVRVQYAEEKLESVA
ncbi:TPA: restriction endonuclease subunit S [Klebsiella quasipneumoniae]|nr:restriction endonuclease subunit S [Klebsiella quasipneumoniae]